MRGEKAVKVLIVLAIATILGLFFLRTYRSQQVAQARQDGWCEEIARQLEIARMPPVELYGTIKQLEEEQRLLGCRP